MQNPTWDPEAFESNTSLMPGVYSTSQLEYQVTPEASLSVSHPGEEALLPDLSDYKINRHFCPAKWTGSRAQQRLGCCKTWASHSPSSWICCSELPWVSSFLGHDLLQRKEEQTRWELSILRDNAMLKLTRNDFQPLSESLSGVSARFLLFRFLEN